MGSGPDRFENAFETEILPDLSQQDVIINQLPPHWPGPVYLLAFPQYLSDRMSLVLGISQIKSYHVL